MNSKIFNVDCISSRTNGTIVKITKLLNKKSRKEEELFTLDGVKLFKEALNFGADIKFIIIKEDASLDCEIVDLIKNLQVGGVQVVCALDSAFSKLTEENAPQGIITVCGFLKNIKSVDFVEKVDENERVMAFESIRDPGNMGTILRNAAAFGIDRVILSSDCADIYSQKVMRASMGAAFKLRIDIVSDVKKTVETLKEQGRRVISTTLKENSLRLGNCEVNRKDVFVVGNEGHGVSDEIINISNETLFIPMCDNTESLNASIASAILMWELFKL
ncbi:MAG: RNA methyltransferase [Clostridia bacterium]|nr:RNA methyltransferase [Clostridia bacterium]